MNTDIKQAMHVEAGKSFGTAEANENERRWDDDKIERKNQDPTNCPVLKKVYRKE